jgi:hypothetical protein
MHHRGNLVRGLRLFSIAFVACATGIMWQCFDEAKRQDPFPRAKIAIGASMADLHVPRERLGKNTLNLHYAISSLREELEAVDWYRQRADDCDDPALKAILLHNMKEEIEHASMVLEWIRRIEPAFDKQLKEYLFREGPIAGREKEATGKAD